MVKPKKRAPFRKKVEDLTAMERTFVACMLSDKTFNATKAAEHAGYAAPSTAACKLLKKDLIQRELGAALQRRIWRCEIDADRVLRELMCIGLFNPQSLFDEQGVLIELTKLKPEVARAIRSIKVSYSESPDADGNFVQVKNVDVQFWDKIAALQLIAKHLGMLDERLKVEHGVSDGQAGDRLLHLIEELKADENRLVDQRVIDAVRVEPASASEKPAERLG